MTAIVKVQIKCDGWWAGVCPSRSRLTVEAENRKAARMRSELAGWTYRRISNGKGNVCYHDVCPPCGAFNTQRSER